MTVHLNFLARHQRPRTVLVSFGADVDLNTFAPPQVLEDMGGREFSDTSTLSCIGLTFKGFD